MKNFTFVVIDDDQKNGLKTKAVAESFSNLSFLALATTYENGLDCVLEHNPDIVFLEIDPLDKESNLSLSFINELHRYLTVIPKIVVTTNNDSLCLNSFKYGVFDYFIHPIEAKELRKTLFRLDKEVTVTNSVVVSNKEISILDVDTFDEISINANVEKIVSDHLISEEFEEKENFNNFKEEILESKTTSNFKETDETNTEELNEEKETTFLNTENHHDKPLIICVKSYGDYRYIDAKDICYLQADNNSTDIHLHTGEMITAFKTLKHFEGVMSYPFVRIHNSYIVNIDFVSRIHTGNAVCHIKNTTTKLPFSKSYKENIDAIITTIASGNYLEI